MSEPQARSGGPRGRGAARGGRGGYSSRGGRPRQAHASEDNAASVEVEDEGELGQLKKQYSSKLSTIREMFPDWTDEDIVIALQETDGDLEGTVERISEGKVSQWGEVKKPNAKDRTRSKAKDSATDGFESASFARGGRGRGDGTRGGRGRGTERGRGTTRGRGGAPISGAKKQAVGEPTADAIPTAEPVSSWGAPKDSAADPVAQPAKSDEDTDAASWEMVTPAEAAPPPAADSQKAGSKPDGTRSWASMLRPVPKPKPAPVKAKPAPTATPKPAPTAEISELSAQEPETPTQQAIETDAPPPDGTAGDIPATPKSPSVAPSETAATLTPSKDELTETNLEQVADSSIPMATETVASNAGTNEPRNISGAQPPIATPQQLSASRPNLGGFATTALKATSGAGRSASFQKRVKEQQEAVVMPGNHAVDRAAVQFGSMGLGGSEDLDADDDREEPETRAQPPQHSPVAPRASLPPAAQQIPEGTTTTRPAPGLPPVPQAAQQDLATQQQQQQQQQPGQGGYNYNQFNSAYGTSGSQGESAVPGTKPYEPFGQQAQQASGHQFDGYPSQSQASGQPGHPANHQQGPYSSAGSEYPSYYTSDNQRNAYGNYYGGYGQHGQSGPHDSAASNRGAGAFGSSGPEQSSVSAISQGSSGRFGTSAEAQASGHSTPNPPVGQHSQQHQSHHMGQGGAGGHGFPYGGHPSYYNSPYYSQYMNNQYGYGGAGGYGSGPYGGGKYGQPQQGYGMSPQTSYNAHSATPAGDYSQQTGSLSGRDSSSGIGGGYGRAGSAQPSESQSHTTGAFGGMSDVFNRSQSSYAQQSSQTGNQQGGNEESRYGDLSKIQGGPSPAPGQVGRPGSAANVQGSQGGLPGSQNQGQQGYGGYPSQMGQHHGAQNQYGGLGGLGGHQQGGAGQGHQNSQYGGYGGGFAGNYYGGSNRGGWGGNYGGH